MPNQEKTFDVIVIGGGPGGYPAAIKAAQMGKSVALIEANKMGGTCLNRGCIPTKTLLANTAVLDKIKHAESFGISVGKVEVNYPKMIARKNDVVEGIRKGLQQLIAANRITVFEGYGKFSEPGKVKVLGDKPGILRADKIIIATGSEPKNIPPFPFDEKKIHSSTSILNLEKLPKKMIIIGAGYIGCEFASLFVDLGVQVILLEMMDRILPMEEEKAAQILDSVFRKKGVDIRVGVTVKSTDTSKTGIQVKLEGDEILSADLALVSIGRKLNSDNIGLELLGIKPDKRGAIPVNDRMETPYPGVYAVGDVTGKWMLAHVATHQGVIAAMNACGENTPMHYNAIPSVVFTHPEIASVGLTEAQAKEKGLPAKLGTFPFQALGKSQAVLETDGFAQIVVHEKTGQILGAQVVGHEASSLIAEMTVAIANELTVECIGETIHAHPTLPEAWHEAAMLAQGTPIHLPPKKMKTRERQTV